MDQKKIDRINFLAKKQREQGLTETEKTEQVALRKEYIESFKKSLVGQLENITIVEPDGTRHKLPKKQNERFFAFKVDPYLRSIVWGGERLKKYGFLHDGNIAESWVVSSIENCESTVGDAPLSQTLKSLSKGFTGGLDRFPLLIKIIDAAQNLSVQVHPDDAEAKALENGVGKTEMWYILDAEKDAFIYYGFEKETSKQDFEQAIKDGTVCSLLHKHPVKAGECYYIPSKTVHAIGKGILIAEIQQPSDITYRVFDYNRPGPDGKPRQLHIEKAVRVSSLAPAHNLCKNDRVLADTPYFTVIRHKIDGKTRFEPSGNLCALLCVEGEVTFENITLSTYTAAIVGANAPDFEISGKGTVLECYKK